jgi:hypothetical protein
MNEKQIVQFCIQNNISVEQYFMLYLTRCKSEGDQRQYLEYTSQFPWTIPNMGNLLMKRMVEFPGGSMIADKMSLTEEFREDIFANTDMGEELYSAYPATFNLSGGGMFVARTGMEKHLMIECYLTKIGRNSEKHKFVMRQLEKYIKLVQANKINGHKLSDWILNEMWETVAAIEGNTSSPFKTDI